MLQSNLQAQTKNILNNNQFNAVRRLGKGGFGHVLLATKATSSTTLYAVKCISKRKMIKDPQLKRFLLQEINTMAMLSHPNIVKLLKTFQQGDWYFLVLQYCDMGNLYNYQTRQLNKVFSLEEGLHILLQVMAGLQYVHQNNIIHRDIKLENIFLKKINGNSYICKIGDFGLARPIGNEQNAGTNCGTEIYMAPEILSRRPYGKQADVWSLGVLFYYLLFADFPFKGINILDQIKSRCKGGFRLSQNLKGKSFTLNRKEEQILNDLFLRLFELVPEKRISLRQIRCHPLLRGDKQMALQLVRGSKQDDKAVEWQLSRIKFLRGIVESVGSLGFLTPWLWTAFKFYIDKVLLYFFTREIIVSYRVCADNNPQLAAELSEFQAGIRVEFEEMKCILLGEQPTQQIQKFEEGFLSETQEFADFKMGYRNTIGRVYEQAHRKLSHNIRLRSIMKLKLFLCHIINRVFTGSVNQAIFPHYFSWLRVQGITPSSRYDFNSLQTWMSQEKPQNLQRSQDIINQMFYK